MKIEAPFLDINGLVLPNPKHEEKPSDNGIYFTSVAVVLGFDVPDYREKIRECYLESGLVARWKANDWDNIAFDDYLGIAAACIYLNETGIPREILRYGILHGFVFNTNKKLELQDWLGRSVQVWALMICAAVPLLKTLMRPILWTIQKFFDRPQDLIHRMDSSGYQLQWMYMEACKNLGIVFKSYEDHLKFLHIVFRQYYSLDHPFNNIFDINTKS